MATPNPGMVVKFWFKLRVSCGFYLRLTPLDFSPFRTLTSMQACKLQIPDTKSRAVRENPGSGSASISEFGAQLKKKKEDSKNPDK